MRHSDDDDVDADCSPAAASNSHYESVDSWHVVADRPPGTRPPLPPPRGPGRRRTADVCLTTVVAVDRGRRVPSTVFLLTVVLSASLRASSALALRVALMFVITWRRGRTVGRGIPSRRRRRSLAGVHSDAVVHFRVTSRSFTWRHALSFYSRPTLTSQPLFYWSVQ